MFKKPKKYPFDKRGPYSRIVKHCPSMAIAETAPPNPINECNYKSLRLKNGMFSDETIFYIPYLKSYLEQVRVSRATGNDADEREGSRKHGQTG